MIAAAGAVDDPDAAFGRQRLYQSFGSAIQVRVCFDQGLAEQLAIDPEAMF
jgi:hypothetical protein